MAVGWRGDVGEMVGIVEAAPFGGQDRQTRCSFCGRREESVAHLVRARGAAYICERCVAQAQEAIASAAPDQRRLRIRPRPARIPDRDEAERAVERAFETVFNAGVPATERCAAIEGGANLAATIDEIRDRHGAARDLDVAVDYVRFLGEDEAEVHFVLLSAQLGRSGLPRTGHALRVGDEWKVARETWCGIVGMVGVRCPPRED
jgi:hypothetical protein